MGTAEFAALAQRLDVLGRTILQMEQRLVTVEQMLKVHTDHVQRKHDVQDEKIAQLNRETLAIRDVVVAVREWAEAIEKRLPPPPGGVPVFGDDGG